MRDIKGYEGLYAVLTNGEIYSYSKYRHKGKILKQHKSDNGYLTVGLTKDKKRKTFLVHRLIASAYIPNPDNKPQVNHIDGNKQNNNIENLEWCSSSENQIHAIRKGLQKFTTKHKEKARITCRKNGKDNKGKIYKSRKTTKEQDLEIKKRFNNGESSLKLAVEFGVSKKTILNIKNDRKY
jgi:hypothetical protein